MSQSLEALFKVALNLEDPWYIKSIEFNKDKKNRWILKLTLSLVVDFNAQIAKILTTLFMIQRREFGGT